MTSSLFSFSTPCLRYKLICALKGQYGWPGFTLGNLKRYLNSVTTITVDYTQLTYENGIPVGGGVQTWTITSSIDRITGATGPTTITPDTTIDAPGYGSTPLPYGVDLNNLPTGWTVTETTFTQVILTPEPPLLGNVVTTIVTTLSNEYTVGQLEADVDALIAGVNPDSQPWNTFQYVGSANPFGPYTPNSDPRSMLPGEVNYYYLPRGGISSPENFSAAAWSVFAPGFVFGDNWFENGGMKMIGYVAMAGNYCEKTFLIDNNQNLLDENCESGAGSCSATFEVTAPPLTPGQNAYVVIVPNCQCGD